MNKENCIEVLSMVGLRYSIEVVRHINNKESDGAFACEHICEAIKFAIEFMEEHDG